MGSFMKGLFSVDNHVSKAVLNMATNTFMDIQSTCMAGAANHAMFCIGDPSCQARGGSSGGDVTFQDLHILQDATAQANCTTVQSINTRAAATGNAFRQQMQDIVTSNSGADSMVNSMVQAMSTVDLANCSSTAVNTVVINANREGSTFITGNLHQEARGEMEQCVNVQVDPTSGKSMATLAAELAKMHSNDLRRDSLLMLEIQCAVNEQWMKVTIVLVALIIAAAVVAARRHRIL